MEGTRRDTTNKLLQDIQTDSGGPSSSFHCPIANMLRNTLFFVDEQGAMKNCYYYLFCSKAQ